MTVRVIEDFSTGYHSRNGGGDLIQTDGDLPIMDLSAVPAPLELEPPGGTDSRDKRPVQIVFGAVVAFLRAGTFLLAGLFVVLPRLRRPACGERWNRPAAICPTRRRRCSW